jgi:hypothetical protein
MLMLAGLSLTLAMPVRAAVATIQQDASELPADGTQRAPTDHEIKRAVDRVKADPNLVPEKTIHTLKWAGSNKPPDPANSDSLGWLGGLLGWIAQSARVLVWTVVIVFVALLGLYLLSLIRARKPAARRERVVTPTHVQDLDIRPESLPDNIGAAARALWDSGEHRAALSLLYRGLLSRLVHVHNVPIRDSSTEGDCLRLTETRLEEGKRGYVNRLVRVWEHAVYGDLQPEASALYSLCDEFSPALDAA